MPKFSRRNVLKNGAVLAAGAATMGSGVRYVDAADRAGARLLIVQTEAPEEVVLERLTGRQRFRDAGHLSDASWDVYLNMQATAEPIRRNYFHT